MSSPLLRIEVAWASRSVQDVVRLELPAGANVGAAITMSGLADRYGLTLTTIRAGIRGRLVRDSTLLADGDRIDLCGPLLGDPKEVRRQRAGARGRPEPKTVPPG